MTYHSCEYISKCEKNSDYILTGKRGVHSMQEKRRWTRNLVSCGEWNTCNIWFLPAPGRSISCKLLSSRLSNSTWSGPPTKRERKRKGGRAMRKEEGREAALRERTWSGPRADRALSLRQGGGPSVKLLWINLKWAQKEITIWSQYLKLAQVQ